MAEDKLFGMGLAAICGNIVLSAKGAMDPMPTAELKESLAYLKERLAQWESRVGSLLPVYDLGYKLIVLEAVRAGEADLEWRPDK